MDNLINSPLSATPSQLSLLDLNDYCFLDIFAYLNVNDLILASTLCKRLEYNAHRLFPHRLRLWKDICDDVKTADFLLSKVGRFITEIEIDGDGEPGITIQETMELLQRNCKYLEKVVLHHTVPSDLLLLPTSLTHISIKFPENWTPTEGFMEKLKSFNNLESLTLIFKQFTEIESDFLTELPPLKQLRLKNCSVEPMHLQTCLANSKTDLESLTIRKCFQEFPDILIESVDRLVKLNELECQFNCAPANFSPFSLFNRLTSLKLTNASASIDVDKLFGALISHNKIQTLSMCSIDIDNGLPLNIKTVKQLHRLTNLRRLNLYETDFVNDEFLLEITKGKSLTHLRYKQTYLPMLSLEAVLDCIALNGPKLQKVSYIVYHDASRVTQNSDQKKELLNTFRKTETFKRVTHCKENISNKLTSVEFSF
ncbi:hypothetical protein HA402_004970 [Bradysia odoriphaga]|nr:hypothetical protein HA402_004970 [Bradysia odoriphaga]